MKIKYNTEFEVNRIQYGAIMNSLSGVCAGIKRGEKFFLKIWLMSYKKEVEYLLNRFA